MSFSSIFKTYDIRGTVPDELDTKMAYAIGKAYANFIQGGKIAVGRDTRLSSDNLSHAIMAGLSQGGATPIDIGLVTTDMVYFAVGKYNYAGGIMITASHNPPEYNGMKMCREKAIPISADTGLEEIRKMAEEIAPPHNMDILVKEEQNVTDAWLDFAFDFVDGGKTIKKFKTVVDAGNGMAGKIMPHVNDRLNLDLIPMFFELDGNFPNHLPNPLDPRSLAALRQRLLQEKADLGMIFDGDADRVFIMDENGEILTGTVTTAMVAEYLLKKNPKSIILYNVICGNIVPEVIEKNGGTAIRTRVGHSLIKADMAKTDALFAGEHSGHYYYRDNYRADSALITALIVLQMLSDFDGSLSEMCSKYRKYPSIDETNFQIEDKETVLFELKNKFSDGEIDELDGITVRYPEFWFNIRASNTEPVLRLNMEADNQEILDEKFSEVVEFLEQYGNRKN